MCDVVSKRVVVSNHGFFTIHLSDLILILISFNLRYNDSSNKNKSSAVNGIYFIIFDSLKHPPEILPKIKDNFRVSSSVSSIVVLNGILSWDSGFFRLPFIVNLLLLQKNSHV